MSTKSKNKFLQWLSEAVAKWPMNTDPVVMQASGYKPTKTGVEYKPSEGAEQLRDNIAVISTVPNMVVNAGMTGIIPAVTSEVGAAAGGVGGTYVGQKLDNKLDTTYWTPTLEFFGNLLGGGLGYKAGNKYGKYAIKHNMLPEGAANRRIVTDDMVKEAALEMVDEQLAKATLSKGLPHNIGWAPAQKAYWWHHSNDPITKFKVPFKERWDVVNHGADPNLIWLTKENGTAGMMAERPYHQQFEVTLKKPMVQVGEVKTIPGQKNTSRNAILKTARDMGADAVIFDGIADNKLRGQKVVAVMGDKTTPTHIEFPKELFATGRGTLDVDFEDLSKNLHRFSSEDREYITKHILSLRDREFAKYKYQNEFLRGRSNFSDFSTPKATPQQARAQALELFNSPSYVDRWRQRFPRNYNNVVGSKIDELSDVAKTTKT